MPTIENPPLGATVTPEGTTFSVWSRNAARIDLCLFDKAGSRQVRQLPMVRNGDVHSLTVPDIGKGTRYGFRADGIYSPDHGLWFDPSKLLVDPYAVELDRQFQHDPRLTIFGEDTADLVPKAIVAEVKTVKPKAPLFRAGGLIYEIAVKPFTIQHPDVPEAKRGTVAALAEPVIIAHLKRLGISAVELMPIVAWIDERHLPPLGLKNGWGYNPIAPMALDPRLVPGGIKELKKTVETLRKEGIGVILDLVFNHSGESDRFGTTLSMRGLDNLTYYRHVTDRPGELINDTGCGNTIACDHPVVEALILDSLRHFVRAAGVDGFRFDLASILGRDMSGFHRDAPLFQAIAADPLLADRVLIAEPWDIGPGGYQLGNFPAPFLEWNDRARDDVRIYWRGDRHAIGALATALAGSSNSFSRWGESGTRTVNFIAAHDGFTLADIVSYAGKHNEANGEENRDGHNENHSWNNGAEGPTADPEIQAARRHDVMALIGTLFATRGTIMLTAGDEGGRSQNGNNNAYCQDNAITWLDWTAMDDGIVAHTAALSAMRRRFDVFDQTAFLTGNGDVEWRRLDGHLMAVGDWEHPATDNLMMVLTTRDRIQKRMARLAVVINRGHAPHPVRLPDSIDGKWQHALTGTAIPDHVAPRSVTFLVEVF
ncbi:glycogen debranching protein GlgX [Ensifer adhaerens]|uniref:glycogen debranching protein GlgX n=1 Tax=Ensifer adhaerens TaxID=106592 RepID=UPI00098E8D98|nr:glycogen debranching protein GlgX [Ensifer adhaerens]